MDRILALLAALPFGAAVLGALLLRQKKAWERLAVAASGASLLLAAAALSQGGLSLALPGLGGLGLHLRLDGFRGVYCCLTGLMWLVSTVFSRDYFAHSPRPVSRYHFFSLLTLGATLGIFLSADLYTTFLFFELLSLVSYPLVAHEQNRPALRAAETYIAVAVIGGLSLLMGLFLLYNRFGTLELDALFALAPAAQDKTGLYVAGGLMMVGFCAKAGMFPLHIWLPKAHPVAPAPASALLSGVLTKTGVFGVIAVSCNLFFRDPRWGLAILIPGTVTMVWGAVLALCSVDLKRTLACSSVSQIGFILVGIGAWLLLGEEGGLAARGTLLHMVNHSLLKLVLFTCAGIVYIKLHRLDLNDIRGFARGRPLFLFTFVMGALGIAGVPLWNGYVSKTLLHESLVEAAHHYHGAPLETLFVGVEWLFLLTGGLTVAYMTKLVVVLAVDRPPPDTHTDPAPGTSVATRVLLTAVAVLLPVLGTVTALYDRLADFCEGFFGHHAHVHPVHYFEWVNLKGAVISLAIGGAVYLLVVRRLLMREGRYIDPTARWIDLENNVYRPVLEGLAAACRWTARLVYLLPEKLVQLGHLLILFLARLAETLPTGAVRLVHKLLLAPRQPRPFSSRFYDRYYRLFRPDTGPPPEEPVLSNGISYALLTFGAGLCVVVAYVVWSVLL